MKKIITLFITALILSSCTTTVSNITITPEQNLCPSIQSGDEHTAGKIIDAYIATLPTQYNPKIFYGGYTDNLDNINRWLGAQTCITKVVMQEGLILTKPPQKAYLLTFQIDGEKINKELDISLGEKLRFVRFHEYSTSKER